MNESTGEALIDMRCCNQDALKTMFNSDRDVDTHILLKRSNLVMAHTAIGYPLESLIEEGDTSPLGDVGEFKPLVYEDVQSGAKLFITYM